MFTEIISNISDLPLKVKGTGMLLVGFFLLQAVSRFFTLHPIRAATNVVYAVIIVLVLSRFGSQIAEFFGTPPPGVQ